MVCAAGGVSAVRIVFRSANFDLCAVLEDRWIHIPGSLCCRAPAGRFRVACGLGRHRPRSDGSTGSAQAGEFQPAERLYLLADSGDFRPRDGSCNRHDRQVDSSQRSCDSGNDGAATELDSDVRGAAIPHASHYLHCSSQAMEGGRALACWRAVTRFGKLTLMKRSYAAWGTLRGLSLLESPRDGGSLSSS